MRARRWVVGAMVVASITAIAAPAGARSGPTCGFPGASWKARAPRTLGLDAAKLQDAFDFATQHSSETVLVVRHGCFAGASRLDPVASQLPMDGWSMTKSVTALLTGRAVTLGKLDIDKPIGRYFPEADRAHARITPRQLLTMSSGLRLTWMRDFNGTELMPDRVRDALSLPFDHKPGAWWEYEQSPVSLLGETVTRAVHRDLQDFAQRELFGPIGIAPGSWSWERDRAGHTQAWAHLKMRSVDWARFGYLILRNGRWNGRQLISAAYMRQFATSSRPNHAYGFFTWLNGKDSFVMPAVNGRDAGKGWLIRKAPRDTIIMAGQDEQRVYIIPSLDMVVVRLGQKGSREPDYRVTVWTSRAGELDNGLMRRIQLAVTDKRLRDPGEYEGSSLVVPTTDEHSYIGSAQRPIEILGGFGLGPTSPSGCTPAGCD